MSEKSPSEFKISLDDEIVDPEETGISAKKPETAREKRGKKPDRSHSWIVFMLVVLIAAAMVLGYMDIRNRLLSVHSTGSQETQHLSEDLQSKFSALTTQLSTLEKATEELKKTGTALTASVSSLDEALKKTDKSISGLKTSKADKTALDKEIKAMEKQISSISETEKKVAADTAVMSAKLSASLTEMTSSSAKASDDVRALQLVVEALQAQKASKKELLTEIDHIENVLKTSGNQSEKQTADVVTSLRRLELRIRSLEAKAGISSPSSSQLPDIKPAADGADQQPPGTPSSTPTQSGDLIERDITQ